MSTKEEPAHDKRVEGEQPEETRAAAKQGEIEPG